MWTVRLIRQLALLALSFGSLLLIHSPANSQSNASALLGGLRYRLVGPARGGRVLAVAGIPGDLNLYYFGAVSGGVWKTTNGGITWQPLFQHGSISSIGSLALAPSNPNVIYIGTGEACIRSDISYGDGVYKSVDGGRTWQHVGLGDTRHIGKVIVHPQNPDIAFVAALGHVYGTNEERGIFRTTDGGRTWVKVLYKDERTGGIDAVFDPNNPNILFAALWQARRTPWGLVSGGPGSGLYKSTDGGTTWKQITGHGLPQGTVGRIGLALSSADSQRIYAAVEADVDGDDGVIFRSDDGGENWQLVNHQTTVTQRGWYYSHITADPQNADLVYVLNSEFFKSTDGGRTFNVMFHRSVRDNHALWIDPGNPRRMILGNDTGANVSTDGGVSWNPSETNQPTGQFYHVTTDNQSPYWIYAAQQDQDQAIAIASATSGPGITRSDWHNVGGNESGFAVPVPDHPEVVYAGGYAGLITRHDDRTKQSQQIQPWPENPMGHPAADLKYRFQWTAPIAVSPHDSSVVYYCAQVVFKSSNGGKSWTVISPDLTRNDKTKQGLSGGPNPTENASAEYYDTIFALAESPKEKDLIWAGTDDGLIHVTQDGGAHWRNVTPKDLPEWARVSSIEPSHYDPDVAYAAVNNYQMDDPRPYIYRTDDLGKTWMPIVSGIPSGSYARVLREDPIRKGLLYAGTETGVFVSFDNGASWQSLQLNLPTAPVHDLVVHGNDLVVGTHGRAIWILDDLSPLRELRPQMLRSRHLFKPTPAVRRRAGGLYRDTAMAGENPPTGAVIYYSLPEEQKGEVTLDILNREGRLVVSYSSGNPPALQPGVQASPYYIPPPASPTKQPGLNRFVWNLRYAGPKLGSSTGQWGASRFGPIAVPGQYEVRLKADGETLTEPLELKPDPKIPATQEDLDAQFKLLTDLRDSRTLLEIAVTRLRDTRQQLSDLRRRIGDENSYSSITKAATGLVGKLSAVENELTEPRNATKGGEDYYPIQLDVKITSLAGMISSADAAPTAAQQEMAQLLIAQLQRQVSRLNAILSDDLAEFNHLLSAAHISPIFVTPVEMDRAASQSLTAQ